MSVDKTDYVIVGYKMPYDVKVNGKKLSEIIWNDERLTGMMEGKKGEPYTLVFDGMSGNYIVFGKTLAVSRDYDGFDFIEIDASASMYFEEVKAAAEQLFVNSDYAFNEPKCLVFSYFS